MTVLRKVEDVSKISTVDELSGSSSKIKLMEIKTIDRPI